MTDVDIPPPWPDPRAAEQARALLPQAHQDGLRFEAYLPPALAIWLLEHIARGHFESPSEAVFVLLGESQELEPYADLRVEFQRRRLQAAIDDPSPPIPAEEVEAQLHALGCAPQLEPAIWKRL